MNDDFKEEFINTSQSKEEFGWSLIEGILELYLFRVYDFNSFLVGALLSFFPSFYYQSVGYNNNTSSFKQQQRRTTFKERFRFFPTKETRRHPLEESKSIKRRFLSSFGLLLVAK
jgi:hypothetical protein